MKKMLCAILAVLLLAGCSGGLASGGSAPASSVPAGSALVSEPQEEPLAVSSSLSASGTPEAHEPVLPLAFYDRLVYGLMQMVFPSFDESTGVLVPEYSGNSDSWLSWLLTWLERLAAENGHPTRFNLPQYDTSVETYEIPADVFTEAFQTWFQQEIDLSQIPAKTDEYQAFAYDESTNTVFCYNENIGWSGPLKTGNPVYASVDENVVTAHVDAQYPEGSMQEVTEGTNEIRLRENSDNTYTLLSYTDVFHLHGELF